MQCVQNEPLEIEERFMYLGIEVPSHHRWSECVIPILEMRKTTYYALHIYKMVEILILKEFLYDTFVVFILVYGD